MDSRWSSTQQKSWWKTNLRVCHPVSFPRPLFPGNFGSFHCHQPGMSRIPTKLQIAVDSFQPLTCRETCPKFLIFFLLIQDSWKDIAVKDILRVRTSNLSIYINHNSGFVHVRNPLRRCSGRYKTPTNSL